MQGLQIIHNAVSEEYADLILQALPDDFIAGTSHGQGAKGNLQIHHFRPVPEHISMISEDAIPQDFKDLIWNGQESDCAIVQRYTAGSGIDWHVDLMKFGDGVAILSLLSPVIMRFRRVDDHSILENIVLPPRSLLLCSGPARYDWEHSIAAVESDVLDGVDHPRSTRISVTMRRISESA